MKQPFRRLPLILIVFVSVLFSVKYGVRFIGPKAYWAAGIISLFYAALATIGPSLFNKLNKFKSGAFIITVLMSMVFCIAVDFVVKPESVKVDRWSAITGWDGKFLRGEYPYEARTHLGGIVSGLPGLFLLTLPFYIAGDIGYFQAATVFLFGLACFMLFKRENGLTVFLLFLLSTGFLWEMYVRSDIGGNAVIVALCLILFERFRGKKTKKIIFLAGILFGIVMTTRTVFIIPFSVYLIRWLDFKKIGSIILFSISSLIFFCALLFPFLVWNLNAFLSNNPFVEQSDKMPISLSVVFVGLAIGCGLFTKTLDRALLVSGYLLFGLISTAFFVKILKVGLSEALFSSRFDISYYMIALPFLILSVTISRAVTSNQCPRQADM